MRLCVIGNSHVGALKLGCSAENVRFFGSHAATLKTLKSRDGQLVSDDPDVRHWLSITSGGLHYVPVNEYDAFIIVGCGLGFSSTSSIYAAHRLAEHTTAGEQVISNAALQCAVKGRVTQSLARRIADLVRQLTKADIAILPEPLPAKSVVQKQPWLKSNAIRQMLFELYREHLALVPHPILEQPSHTFVEHFTRTEFARGSLKMLQDSTPHPEAEPYHMNAEYGSAVMSEALDYLKQRACETGPDSSGSNDSGLG